MADSAATEFQSYLFFLRHFRQLIHLGRGPGVAQLLQDIINVQAGLVGHLQQKQLSPEELGEVRKYVFTAWNAEGVARLSSLFDQEVRQFTNQWKPIQAYYGIYFLLVALHTVVQGTAPKRHEPALRWATQTILPWFPMPWSLQLNYDAGVLHGFPAGTPMRGPSGWNVTNNEPYMHVANYYRRTAERDQREDWRDRYKGNKKRRIGTGPRKGKMYRIQDVPVDPIAIFNVLWRFRRWANYLEADTIIEGGGDFLPHAVEFDEAFNDIVETTAAVFEHVLRRYLGHGALHALYQQFINLVGGRLDTAALVRRRNIICP